MRPHDDSLPVEEFIQALTSQLDRAQRTLALKAKAGLPLTFAVKEMEVDLRAHLFMEAGRVRMQSAGPADAGASVMRLSFTTITRPMIEENTFEVEAGDVTLDEALGDDVSEEERRRLEWAGIHTVSQLRQLEEEGGKEALEQVVQIPAVRLRQALARATRPIVRAVTPLPTPEPAAPSAPVGDGAVGLRPADLPVAPRPPLGPVVAPDRTPPLDPTATSAPGLRPAIGVVDAPIRAVAEPVRRLRVGGANLLRGGVAPTVKLGGRPVSVVQATDRELVLDVPEGPIAGDLVVEPAEGLAATFSLDGWDDAPGADEPAPAPEDAPDA